MQKSLQRNLPKNLQKSKSQQNKNKNCSKIRIKITKQIKPKSNRAQKNLQNKIPHETLKLKTANNKLENLQHNLLIRLNLTLMARLKVAEMLKRMRKILQIKQLRHSSKMLQQQQQLLRHQLL